MNDSFFRKEIQRKLAEGNATPSADRWREIEKAVIKENRRRKKRDRKFLLMLLPFLAIGCAFAFWQHSTQSVVSQVADSPIDFPSGNEGVGEIGSLEFTTSTSNFNSKLSSDSNSTSTSKLNFNSKLKSDSKTTSNSNSNFNSIFNSNSNQKSKLNSVSEPIVATVFESEKVEIKKEILAFQPISAQAAFLEINQNILDFIPSGNEVTPSTEPIVSIPKISVGFAYEQNALEYCFDQIGQNQRVQLALEYRFLPRFSAGVGVGYQTINYEFQVDPIVHIGAFGNTDKYPEFYENKHFVQSIKSEMSHFILPISLKYHQPIFGKMEAFVGARQDFLFNEDQDLTYSLSGNIAPLSYTGNNNNFQFGFTTFSAGLEYQIHPKLKAGAVFNRLISFETLGMERQFYHGFGGGANLSFQF